MADSDIFGRQLLASVLAELCAIGKAMREAKPDVCLSSCSLGAVGALCVVARNLPFEENSRSHLVMAELLLKSYFELSGESPELEGIQQKLQTIKEQLYGNPAFNKSTH